MRVLVRVEMVDLPTSVAEIHEARFVTAEVRADLVVTDLAVLVTKVRVDLYLKKSW